MKQDKKWWKEYWKKQDELTKQDLKHKQAIEEAKYQEAINNFGPVPTVSAPGYLEWHGQLEGHSY